MQQLQSPEEDSERERFIRREAGAALRREGRCVGPRATARMVHPVRGLGPSLCTPALATHWVCAAAREGGYLGRDSCPWVRRSKCSMSPMRVVPADGTTVPTCVSFDGDDLFPLQGGRGPVQFHLTLSR